jgi:hypothetical protein
MHLLVARLLARPLMAVDVYLVNVSADPEAVVVRRWVGGRGVRNRAETLLGRGPDHTDDEAFSATWRVRPPEAVEIARAHYVDGPTPEDVCAWATAYPEGPFWWSLLID